MPIYIAQPLYVEAYYVLYTFVFNPFLEHSECAIFTYIMQRFSKCLNSFENIPVTNERIMKTILFDFEI